MKNGRASRILWVLLACAGLLYLLSLRAYFVGFFNDDAFYIIGARSLLQGRYAELNSPDLRPLDNYPPGYPLVLALWSVFGGSPLSFQLLSVLLTAASVWLLWKIMEGESEVSAAAAACAAFALGPMAASLSGVVLSEVLFMPLALLCLLLARRWWAKLSARQALALGALAGYAALVRLSGASLWLAFCLGLAFEKRWKRAAAAAAGAAVFAPWLLRNAALTGRSETRVAEMLQGLPGAAGGAFHAARFYAHEAFARALFRFPPGWVYAEAAAAAAAVLLFAWGLRAWGLTGWRKLPAAFLALYAAVHLLWPYQSSRYVYPVLPLVAAFLFIGAERAGGKRLVWGSLALSLFLGAFPVSAVVRASFRRDTAMSRPPERTYGWIRANTPANAVYAADLDGRLYILTGRRAAHLPPRSARDAFAGWLKDNPVDFVLVFPNERVMRRERGAGGADPMAPEELRALLSDLKRFEPVFRSAEEGSIVYRVRR